MLHATQPAGTWIAGGLAVGGQCAGGGLGGTCKGGFRVPIQRVCGMGTVGEWARQPPWALVQKGP